MPAKSVTLIALEALFVTSATLVATIEYKPAADGATYVAEFVVTLVNVPHALPEQFGPEANHVTPAAPTSFVTVAVTGNTWVTTRLPRFGETATLTAAVAVTVIAVDALFVVSFTDVAVRVAAGCTGTDGGAA